MSEVNHVEVPGIERVGADPHIISRLIKIEELDDPFGLIPDPLPYSEDQLQIEKILWVVKNEGFLVEELNELMGAIVLARLMNLEETRKRNKVEAAHHTKVLDQEYPSKYGIICISSLVKFNQEDVYEYLKPGMDQAYRKLLNPDPKPF
jgi:hypothetical protein